MVVAQVPFPLLKPEQVLEGILSCVNRRTRLALIDHVTSSTAVVFPVARIIQELEARGLAR